MTINGNFLAKSPKNPLIHVAVGVLMFGHQLLLATRLEHQHQGGKLEFVGGKIESEETPIQALMREIKEEIGLDIGGNVCTKLGRIYHDYPQKSVCLHVYQVLLSDSQYHAYKDKRIGNDGQAIGFYDKTWVSSQAKRFPDANRQMLQWLTLPSIIVVSQPLTKFDDMTAWAAFYAQKLAHQQVMSVRLQTDCQTAWQALLLLAKQRKDIVFILPWQMYQMRPKDFDGKILAVRLTHGELMSLDIHACSVTDVPIIASCHDSSSLEKANLCAKQLSILGVFLSPVLPTATHPKAPALGWQNFSCLASRSDVPVIALGGLSVSDSSQAYQYGAVAVSGIRNFV